MTLRLLAPDGREVPLVRYPRGYWRATVAGVGAGARYRYRLDDDRERPDPASGWQPEGVFGPSAVVDHAAFPWTDTAWRGLAWPQAVIYELHVGSFTPAGSFDAIIPRLPELRELGVTALELMPVAAFPGARNWGYDGVFPFAAHAGYGGPDGLKRLVDACHRQGLAVILDVVYNHLGPEGNVLGNFGPYVTDAYRTPWGGAINLDGPQSDPVRRYFIDNALGWLRDYHIDALRLDAVHALYDLSARPFLAELAAAVRAFSRRSRWPRRLIAESDRNDARLLRPPAQGGDGLDALWSEDFHHALHALLTGERQGYYADFGRLEDLAAACREGFVYAGRYSRYRRRRHGNSAADRPPEQFVVFSQNHDQVGNRRDGERLLALAGFEAAKLAAAAVCLAPAIPLLFMGEEYGEAAPFLYFVDFADSQLMAAVRRGRAEEFRAFAWTEEPPDPAAAATFERSRLSWRWTEDEHDGVLRRYYRTLLALRRDNPALALPEPGGLEVAIEGGLLQLHRRAGGRESWLLLNPSLQEVEVSVAGRGWLLLLASADRQWLGPGAALPAAPAPGVALQLPPHSCAVYGRKGW